ncbi:hypothetical protein [Komagataeibacter oboediens]|uniref:hypothetical protein n=1 Tax=Komagataeibacter oboediens TaxID=65958 RepID=UPI0019CD9D74|nr:hypothetical protein [Komagataeibacter oboediens]GCE81842.1 hypothetical protein MSKU3_3317 [Komagataeibacter oboediens]
MELIIGSGTVVAASRDTMPATGTPGWATDGDPASSIPATDFPASHYNMTVAEMVQVILDAGLTLDRTNWGQLSAAIQKLIANAFGGSTFTPVQQGGGPNQTADKICIGADSTGIGGIRYALMNGTALTDQGFILRSYAPNPAVGDTAFTNIYYAGGLGRVWAAISESVFGQLAWYSDVTGVQTNLTAALAAQADTNANIQAQMGTLVSGAPQVSTDAQGIKIVLAAGSTSPDGTARPQFYYDGGNSFLGTLDDIAALKSSIAAVSSGLSSETTTRADQVSDLTAQVDNRIVGLAGSGFISVQSLVVDQTSQNLTLNLGNGVVAQEYAQVQTGVIDQDPIFGWWEKTRLPNGQWLLKQYITCASWAGNAAVNFPIPYVSPPQITITTSDDNGNAGTHKSTFPNYVRDSLTAVGVTLDVWLRDTSGNFEQSTMFDGNITAVGVVNS